MRILMSIKSKFARMIFAGQKTVELRRRLPKRAVPGTRVIVYSSGEDMAMIGWFEVSEARMVSRNEAIAMLPRIGITRSEFDAYCGDLREVGVIEIARAKLFARRWPLKIRPPQSYMYLSDEIAGCQQ